MSEESGHKAMLYFLEVLMNSNGSLTISQLAGRFGSKSFTTEMRIACGGNEIGLKLFLERFPSLFTIKGNTVSLFDASSPINSPTITGIENNFKTEIRNNTTTSGKISSNTNFVPGAGARLVPDVSLEMSAVNYFQSWLAKKDEKWVNIKSLAGHLSQANDDIRNLVGPQIDFKKWLLRHPHIFEVQGELVAVKDNLASLSTPAVPSSTLDKSNGYNKTDSSFTRNHLSSSFRKPTQSSSSIKRSKSFNTEKPDLSLNRFKGPISMSASEYKAIMFLKDILEKRFAGKAVQLPNLLSLIANVPDSIKNVIGATKSNMEKFFESFSSIFNYDAENSTVMLWKTNKLNVIITGSKPKSGTVNSGPNVLTACNGIIYHVAKLWGIVDLGKHEHVFFDKSIMIEPIEDLTREFSKGETLWFNAVLSAKTSRAKWRATHVWKEDESAPQSVPTSAFFDDTAFLMEDEINSVLPSNSSEEPNLNDFKDDDYQESNVSFNDLHELRLNLSGYAQQKKSSETASSESSSLKNNQSTSLNLKKFKEISCQTLSTGDIIATMLYHEP